MKYTQTIVQIVIWFLVAGLFWYYLHTDGFAAGMLAGVVLCVVDDKVDNLFKVWIIKRYDKKLSYPMVAYKVEKTVANES